MAHYVELNVPKAALLNRDVEFHAHADDDGNTEVIGKLEVSKGGVEWVPKYKQKGIQMKWREFARFMEERA
ncbi:MAG: hypothetical protein ACOCYG_09665 [Spirochaetota bacterium]